MAMPLDTSPDRAFNGAVKKAFSKQTYQNLDLSLEEDLGSGDLTARLLIASNAKGRAVILSKQSGIFCGEEPARFLFRKLDRKMRFVFRVRDGQAFRKGQILIELSGNIRAILGAERAVLNLIGRLSGIASLTHEFCRSVKSYGVNILDTRKTTPLWRELEKYAVKTGGGKNHRMGLYDAVLVKENHRPFGDLSKLKRVSRQFEIEVRGPREIEQALKLNPGVILFDNFSPASLKKAVQRVRQQNKKVILEASGGVNLNNVKAYARTGVNRISIGALTHSVQCADFSLLIREF